MAAKKKKAKKRSPAVVPKKPIKKKKAKGIVKRASATADLIRRAETAFIKDENGQGVDWHFHNGDFEKYVSIDTFRSWSKKGNWIKRRIEYWESIQTRLLDHLSDKILDQKIQQLGELHEVKDAVAEYLKPLRDPKTNKILKDEKTGLPKFAVDLPPYDRLVKAFLELDNRIALRTGEATERIDVDVNEAKNQNEGRRLLSQDEASNLMRITPEEAQQMARQIVMSRSEHLQDDVIDAEFEVEDGDDEKL